MHLKSGTNYEIPVDPEETITDPDTTQVSQEIVEMAGTDGEDIVALQSIIMESFVEKTTTAAKKAKQMAKNYNIYAKIGRATSELQSQ